MLFEGVPTHPDAGRCWQLVEKHKVTQFYTGEPLVSVFPSYPSAPTAIRALHRLGDAFPNHYDLSSLRILGSVGEPINPEAWNWLVRLSPFHVHIFVYS